MGLSLIAVNQREKEEKQLWSFLTYSLLGSVAFHALLLFFGTMLWENQMALAEDPIEVVMVDPPVEEKPPEPTISPSPPAPSPSPVVTPKLATPLPQPKPIETPIPPPPPPPVPPKLATPLPQPKPIVTPIAPPPPPPVPPKLAESLPETPPPEPPKPVVTPTTPVEPEREVTQLRRNVAQNQPLRPSQERRQPPLTEEPLRQSAPDEPVSSNTPLPAPPVPTQPSSPVNPVAPRQQTVARSTALPGEVGGGSSRQGRLSLDNPSNSPSGSPGSSIAGEDTGIPSSGLPETAAVNRGEPPRQPVAGSTALPGGGGGGGSGGFGQGRPSFDNPGGSTGGSAGGSGGSEDTGIPSSGLPGTVAVNQGSAPRRPVAGSTALPGGGGGGGSGGSGGFGQGRPSFDNLGGSGSGSGSGFGGSEDTGIGSSGAGPGRVAANQGIPPRPPSNGGQGTDGGGGDAGEVDGEGLSCLSACDPEYPNRLVQRNIQGRPVIRFVVDTSGRPRDMRVAESSGNSELDNAAIEAVRKMRFAPPGSRPQPARMGITFRLRG